MFAENPVLTTKRFVSSWRGVHPQRLYQEIESVHRETNRLKDISSFIIRSGELIDPATNKAFDFERNNPIEIAEGKVWDDLKQWANKSLKGKKAVWLSPMFEGRMYTTDGLLLTKDGIYPSNKVCFYEVDETNDTPPVKILQSTTILFDAPKDRCLLVAEKFNPLITNVKDPEFLRNKLFKLEKDFTILDILEMVGQTDEQSVPTPSEATISYFVREIKSGKDAGLVVREMRARGIIGGYSISCSTRSSVALTANSRILNFSQNENWTWHTGNCVILAPECGKTNVEVGPCGVCRDCQKKFDENPNFMIAA